MTDAARRRGADRRTRRVARPALAADARRCCCAASLVMLYPLLWMLASSFKPEDEIFSSAPR